MKPKVYLETTIPSYLMARPSRDLVTAAHQQITREWWDTRREDFDLFITQMVIDERALAIRKRLHAGWKSWRRCHCLTQATRQLDWPRC
jgi:hypothetical protein